MEFKNKTGEKIKVLRDAPGPPHLMTIRPGTIIKSDKQKFEEHYENAGLTRVDKPKPKKKGGKVDIQR